jgi:hypothetical protein
MELAFGNIEAAVRLARRVLDRKPGYDSQLRAALVLGRTGFTREADAIVKELTAANPAHTIIQSVLAPIVRAGIELSCQRPTQAVAQLEAAAPYELGFMAAFAPVYLRAQAYQMMGAGDRAALQFQHILDHRGTDPFSPFHAVAAVGLARARAMAGDSAGSRQAYESFFAGWAEADSDVPVLLEARDEYIRLSGVAARR